MNQPTPIRRATMRAHLNIHSGYGLSVQQTFDHLQRQGIFVSLRAIGVNEMWNQSLPVQMKGHVVVVPQPEEWEILFAPPTNPVTPRKKTLFYTMWEASALPPREVSLLSKAAAIVVPCQWCKTSFEQSGVKVPIYVNPLGYDPEVFFPRPKADSKNGPFIIGVAGRVAHCPKRKGVQPAIDLFCKTFPVGSQAGENVRLHVKIHPDDKIVVPANDNRIKVFREVWEPYQLAGWLRELDLFLTLSRSEGYGLWPLQAMACGIPVAGCAFSGHADFMNAENSFLIPFREVACDGVGDSNVEYLGEWAEPNTRVAGELLTKLVSEWSAVKRLSCADMGVLAAESVKHLTWENSARGLVKIMEQCGALQSTGEEISFHCTGFEKMPPKTQTAMAEMVKAVAAAHTSGQLKRLDETPPKRNSISLVMLVLNEAEFIRQSLESVAPFVDEVIVIDQGSTDGTLDIIRRFPAAGTMFLGKPLACVKIIQSEGNFLTLGEKHFRDLAASACNSEWLMIIDGDEVLSPRWQEIVYPWLEAHGERHGMVMIDYYQMVGSCGFHTPDSPLPNERPFLVKKHSGLRGSESANGTQCHSSYKPFIAPNSIGRLPSGPVACFHLGYAKKDLVTRFERNILRGDWTKDATEMAIYLEKAKSDPTQFLPECVPARDECVRLMPAWMRRLDVEPVYDSERRRLVALLFP